MTQLQSHSPRSNPNPDTLYGVFGDAQWTNKDRLSDALLKDLVEHFSRLSFGNENVASGLIGDESRVQTCSWAFSSVEFAPSRLLNVAKAQGADFNQVLVRFALEPKRASRVQSTWKAILLVALLIGYPHGGRRGKLFAPVPGSRHLPCL